MSGSRVYRRFPFAMVPEWILFHPDLSDRAVRLWGILARHGTEEGGRIPGRSRLAALCGGCSLDSLDRAKRELVKAGALVVEARFDPPLAKGSPGSRVPNDQRTNAYHLVDEPPGGSRTHAATGSRTGAHTGSRTHAAGVAAPVRPKRESLTEKPIESELPCADVVDAPRPRDEIWDALMEVCGIESGEIPTRMRGAYGRAVKSLREVDATPEEIHRRAAIMVERWGDKTLTPSGLASRWAELRQRPKTSSGPKPSTLDVALGMLG